MKVRADPLVRAGRLVRQKPTGASAADQGSASPSVLSRPLLLKADRFKSYRHNLFSTVSTHFRSIPAVTSLEMFPFFFS